MIGCNYNDSNLYIVKKGRMKINGVGTVKAVPDIAIFDLGVITENMSLKSAQEENAIKSNSVISSLYEMGIQKKQIRTKSYNIEPIYDYVEGKQIFKGYRVANILSVTITDLMRIGEVIDNAVSAGANRVDNISFTVADPSIYYDRALNLAIKDAVRKALKIGTTLNIEVDETPYKITEEGVPVALGESPMLKMSAVSTPILPGQLDVTARIETIFEYKQ